MHKHIQNVSIENLKNHFTRHGMDVKKPLLLAIDCDRTIVDRKKSSHAVSKEVVEMFRGNRPPSTPHGFANTALFNKHMGCHMVMAINTGRDLTSYAPLERQLLHTEPCVFLSGRVIRYGGHIITMPSAILPQTFCMAVWKLFLEGIIPFLDVKHASGNTFFCMKGRNTQKYHGLYKPVDWFHDMTPHAYVARENETAETLLALQCVRMELPFTPSLFDLCAQEDLMCVSLPLHPSHGQEPADMSYMRIMVNNTRANKGLGLAYLSHVLNIPERNVICFGDSSGDTASDAVVKRIMPKATLLIAKDGDQEALSCADFIIDSVEHNGVPRAVSMIAAAYSRK